MTTTFLDEASIAVGHNNAGGLVLVTALIADSQLFQRPFLASGDTLGIRQPAPGGGQFRRGKPSQIWGSVICTSQGKKL